MKDGQINNTVCGIPIVISRAIPDGWALMAPDNLLKKVAAGKSLSVDEASQCYMVKSED